MTMTAYGKRWSNDEENRLFEMAKNGIDRDMIAEKLGRTRKAIDMRLLKIGSEMLDNIASGGGGGGGFRTSDVAKLLGFTKNELLEGYEQYTLKKEEDKQKKDASMTLYAVPLLRKIYTQLKILTDEIKALRN
jgi:hypothetical protein